MLDDHIHLEFRFVDKNELSQQNGLVTHIETTVHSCKVQLDYDYVGEPNYNRIQLKLSGAIGEKNIIDYYGLNPDIELPYQYPKRFELIDCNRDFVAIPHNQGVYILRVNSNNKYLIEYQTDRFTTCFFVDNLFVLVEEKGLKIVDLADFKESSILFDDKKGIYVNAIQIQGNLIYAVIQDVYINRMKLFVFDRLDFSIDNYSEYTLSDLTESTSLAEGLRYEKETKLARIPDFKFNSLIDSWRFVANGKWNSLIGRIEYWLHPIKEGEYFIRKEKYDFVELEIKTFANKV